MRKAAVCFLALFAALHASGADKVVGGPYVVNVGPRSATVMWVVETSQASLGTAPGKADNTGRSFTMRRAYEMEAARRVGPERARAPFSLGLAMSTYVAVFGLVLVLSFAMD